MRILTFLLFENEINLLKRNREAVSNYNFSLLKVLNGIVMVLMLVLMIFSYAADFEIHLKVLYFSFFLASLLVMFTIFLFEKFIKKHPLPLIYLLFFIAVSFSILVNFANIYAVEYVTFTCILLLMQILLLDRSLRVNIFTICMFFYGMILSYLFKKQSTFIMDMMNTTSFFAVGIFIGLEIRKSRLENFEANRKLLYERNTDSLTDLPNRRSLFENLKKSEGPVENHVSGMFMIDIDHFKLFNDSYGHRAGDVCLFEIGKCFKKFGLENGISFFRYGGEEFCGLCFVKNQEDLKDRAENLREAVADLEIPFPAEENPSNYVSISIGYAYFEPSEDYDYEIMIKKTDAALYQAKNSGRNKICSFEELENAAITGTEL